MQRFATFLLLYICLHPTPTLQAQNHMVTYQTEEGWYVYNTAGKALMTAEGVGLTGPVHGPVYGYLNVRQFHALDKNTLQAETHEILMDVHGNRYLEENPVKEQITGIIEGKYVLTRHQDDGSVAVYVIRTGKEVLRTERGKHMHVLAAHFDQLYIQGEEDGVVYAYNLKTGKVSHTLGGLNYVHVEEGKLIAVKTDGSEWLVDSKGTLQTRPADEGAFVYGQDDDADTAPFEVAGSAGALSVKDGKGRVLATGLDADAVEYYCHGYIGYRKGANIGVFHVAKGKEVVSPSAGFTDITPYDGFLEANNKPAKSFAILDDNGKPMNLLHFDDYVFFRTLFVSGANCKTQQEQGLRLFVRY